MIRLEVDGSFYSHVIKQGDGSWATYDIRETLIGVLRQPLSSAGVNYEEMEVAARTIRAIKEGEDVALLQKDEHDHLCAALKNYRFPQNDPGIHDWISGILALKELPN